jgi:hypothetical protein
LTGFFNETGNIKTCIKYKRLDKVLASKLPSCDVGGRGFDIRSGQNKTMDEQLTR